MVSLKVSLALFAATYVIAQSVAGDASVVAHTGESVGKELEYGNSTWKMLSCSTPDLSDASR